MPRQLLASHLERAVIGGEEIVSAAVGARPFLHPWASLQAAWLPGKFGPAAPIGIWGLVVKPGFVNGIDPIAKGAVGYDESAFRGVAISSQRASLGQGNAEVAVVGQDKRELFLNGRREDIALLRGPIIPLDFDGGQEWPQARPVPAAIALRGVPSKVGAVADAGEARRRAVSVDLVLGVARQTVKESVDVQDAAYTGRLVQYGVAFDDLVMRTFGTRPFLYTVPNADDVLVEKTLSLEERFFGQTQTDDGLDKVHVLRAWAISPPFTGDDAPAKVGPEWDVDFEYRQFWNLAYKTRVPRLRQPLPPIAFGSGLAWGLGDAIINYNLGLQDEILSRIFLAGANLSPKGKFWSVG